MCSSRSVFPRKIRTLAAAISDDRETRGQPLRGLLVPLGKSLYVVVSTFDKYCLLPVFDISADSGSQTARHRVLRHRNSFVEGNVQSFFVRTNPSSSPYRFVRDNADRYSAAWTLRRKCICTVSSDTYARVRSGRFIFHLHFIRPVFIFLRPQVVFVTPNAYRTQ